MPTEQLSDFCNPKVAQFEKPEELKMHVVKVRGDDLAQQEQCRSVVNSHEKSQECTWNGILANRLDDRCSTDVATSAISKHVNGKAIASQAEVIVNNILPTQLPRP